MATSALHTSLCERLGIRNPIVQTGMGYVAVPELAAATSNAGGLGFLQPGHYGLMRWNRRFGACAS